MISWPGCVVDDERLDSFTESLRSSPAFFDGDKWLFHRVTSGRDVLRQLTDAPMLLSIEDAKQRIRGSLLGPHGVTTSVVIGFNESGLDQRGRLVPLIRAAASKFAGADYPLQHLAGPIVDGYEVHLVSQTTMTALLIVLPPLIQVLAIAGDIHLVNDYFDSAHQSFDGAIKNAVRIGWLPCVLSSTTTAIGLGSLAVSGLAAVREFGIFAAIGVMITLGALLILIPGIIHWKPVALPMSRNREPSPGWLWLLWFQSRHAGLVSLLGIALMIALGLGVARLQASVRIETLFGSESRLILDHAWIEQHVGPLVPIEVIGDLLPGFHSAITFSDPR